PQPTATDISWVGAFVLLWHPRVGDQLVISYDFLRQNPTELAFFGTATGSFGGRSVWFAQDGLQAYPFQLIGTPISFSDGQWHSAVHTLDYANSLVSLSIDGEETEFAVQLRPFSLFDVQVETHVGEPDEGPTYVDNVWIGSPIEQAPCNLDLNLSGDVDL